MKINTHTLKVKVTDEHIKNGTPDSCSKCAMALAIQSAIDRDGIPWSASVSFDFLKKEASIGLSAWEWWRKREGVKSCSVVKAKYPYEENNQIKINYFVKEYDENFVSREEDIEGTTVTRNGFIPIHCKPFEFELRVIT